MKSIEKLSLVVQTLNALGELSQALKLAVSYPIEWTAFQERVLFACTVVDYSDSWPLIYTYSKEQARLTSLKGSQDLAQAVEEVAENRLTEDEVTLELVLVKDSRLKYDPPLLQGLLAALVKNQQRRSSSFALSSYTSSAKLEGYEDHRGLLGEREEMSLGPSAGIEIPIISTEEHARRLAWLNSSEAVQRAASSVERVLPTAGEKELLGCTSLSASMTPNGETDLYWVHCQGGTFGVLHLASRCNEVLAEALHRPTRVEAMGHIVYVLEEGEASKDGGRLSAYNSLTKEFNILLQSLSYPAGLHVSATHSVMFIERMRRREGGSTLVSWRLAGLPPSTLQSRSARAPEKITFLQFLFEDEHSEATDQTQSGHRLVNKSLVPEDIAVDTRGVLYLAYARVPTEPYGLVGAVSIITPLAHNDEYCGSGEWEYQGGRPEWLYFGLSPVKSLSLSPSGRILLAGCGSSSICPERPTALATAPQPGDPLRVLFEGFATSAVFDNHGNIFFCSSTGTGEIMVLRKHGEGQGAPYPSEEEFDNGDWRVRAEELAAIRAAKEREDTLRSRADDMVYTRMSLALTKEMKSFSSTDPSINTESDQDGSLTPIRVLLRARPLFDEEKALGASSVLSCTSSTEITIDPTAPYLPRRTFTFDRVFGPSTTQHEVYREVESIVTTALQGYNCTIFAYGQTGSGKTHTMEGSIRDPERAGIISRSIHTIFDTLNSSQPSPHTPSSRSSFEYTVKVSHLEIYNEELTDLLEESEGSGNVQQMSTTSKSLFMAARKRGINVEYKTGASSADEERISKESSKPKKLQITKDPVQGIIVKGLEEVEVTNAAMIFSILEKSLRSRHVAETLCNKNMSRFTMCPSPFILASLTDSFSVIREGQTIVKRGRLNLVDLSGSENFERAGGKKERKREAASIGQGLLALGRVIQGLVNKWGHIPYRESKLTRLLEESLGGNSLTTLILTVSPSQYVLDETLSTLNYSTLARKVQNTPKRNKVTIDEEQRAALETEETKDFLSKESGETNVAPVRPWEGAVPILRPKTSGERDRRAEEGRWFHAQTLDWARAIKDDDKLNGEAVAGIRTIFDKYDSDLDGFLSPEETRRLDRHITASSSSGVSNVYNKLGWREKDARILSFSSFCDYFRNLLAVDPLKARHILASNGLGINFTPLGEGSRTRPLTARRGKGVIGKEKGPAVSPLYRGTMKQGKAEEDAQSTAEPLPTSSGALQASPSPSLWDFTQDPQELGLPQTRVESPAAVGRQPGIPSSSSISKSTSLPAVSVKGLGSTRTKHQSPRLKPMRSSS